MKLAMICFTKNGEVLCRKLMKETETISHQWEAYSTKVETGLTFVASLSKWVAEVFETVDGIVFVGACGIAVRAIAPFLKSKTTDPAVVVLDEGGNFSISLLAGHVYFNTSVMPTIIIIHLLLLNKIYKMKEADLK